MQSQKRLNRNSRTVVKTFNAALAPPLTVVNNEVLTGTLENVLSLLFVNRRVYLFMFVCLFSFFCIMLRHLGRS